MTQMAHSAEAKNAEISRRIAQVKFKQALKLSLPSVSLESSAKFCDDIDATLKQNTAENVQTCKKWIVEHITPFKDRVAVLGDYLVAASKFVAVEKPAKSTKAARNRLTVLLVVSDVLHANKFHQSSIPPQGTVAATLRPYIEQLVELAAKAVPGKDSPAETKLKSIVNFWAASGCISVDDFNSMRERAEEGLVVAQGGTPQRKRTYALPDWFGDRSAPWHALSASYMVEPLLKNPDRPIPANAMTARRFGQKQPSDRVRKLLENYFENIDLHYMPTGDNPSGETKKYKLWLDSMGQLVKQNKETGETSTVYNSYGWSMKFCKEMQENGVPGRVTELREDYKEKARAKGASRWGSPPRDYGGESRSPSHRRYSISSDSRSPSRSSSFDQHRPEDRPSSGNDSDNYHDQRRPSSRDNYNGRPGRFGGHHKTGRGGPPPGHLDRNPPSSRQSRWNDDRIGHPYPERNNYNGPPHQHNSYTAPNPPHAQGFQPHTMSGFGPPPAPGQYSGYQGFPPPPPPHAYFQAAGTQAPHPPPPMNFQGPYHGTPANGAGFQNNPYQYGSNNVAYGNNSGYGGQPQGNHRGGFQGGFQGRGGSRGGHHGSQRGRGQSRY